MVSVGLHQGGVVMTQPTVLLIHGFLDDASVWDGLVECLAGEVAAVRYDLPGFGTRSGSVDEASRVTLESLAAEAGGFLAEIAGPVVVVGQSLGTQVAELVAAQDPDRFRGLVLLTPVPLGGTQLPDEVVAPFRALGGDRPAQHRLRAELSPHLGEVLLDRLTDIGAPVAAEVTAHYVDVWNNGIGDAPTTSAYRGPVMIIRGGADGFVTEQLVDTISPRFVQPEIKVIDKGGHWVHAEYAGTVATMILDFIDAIEEVAK
jgi:pimeloyl-ACP methyl ester carboxylesterase